MIGKSLTSHQTNTIFHKDQPIEILIVDERMIQINVILFLIFDTLAILNFLSLYVMNSPKLEFSICIIFPLGLSIHLFN